MEASTSGIDFNLDETSGNLDNLFFINEDSDVDVDDDIFVNDIFCSDGEELIGTSFPTMKLKIVFLGMEMKIPIHMQMK